MLPKWMKVKQVTMDSNTSDPCGLENATQLVIDFDLLDTEIEDFTHISKMKNLECLDFHGKTYLEGMYFHN